MNVLTAQLLQEQGLVAAPEQIIRNVDQARRMPDVLVDFNGLRMAIEGEYEAPRAEQKASDSALRRVEEGLVHIGLALVYPSHLRTFDGPIDELKTALKAATVRYAVVTEVEAVAIEQLAFSFVPAAQEKRLIFVLGDLHSLADDLRRAYDQLVKDVVLDRAVELLERSIDVFSFAMRTQDATTKRFAVALGIRELPNPKSTPAREE
jgi:hypothetical protein